MSSRSKDVAVLEMIGSKHPYGYNRIGIDVSHDDGRYEASVYPFKWTEQTPKGLVISDLIGISVKLDKGRFSEKGLSTLATNAIRNPAILEKLRMLLQSHGAELAEVHVEWIEAIGKAVAV